MFPDKSLFFSRLRCKLLVCHLCVCEGDGLHAGHAVITPQTASTKVKVSSRSHRFHLFPFEKTKRKESFLAYCLFLCGVMYDAQLWVIDVFTCCSTLVRVILTAASAAHISSFCTNFFGSNFSVFHVSHPQTKQLIEAAIKASFLTSPNLRTSRQKLYVWSNVMWV